MTIPDPDMDSLVESNQQKAEPVDLTQEIAYAEMRSIAIRFPDGSTAYATRREDFLENPPKDIRHHMELYYNL